MIATETIVPSRKLKIKFSTKRIEVKPETECELRQKAVHVDDGGFCNLKDKSSVKGSNKRGPLGSYEGQKEKRQKLDRKASQQCAAILKSLTSHRYSWVFGKPVDPVALNIPDYFSIISEPMDLGTIKSKLEKNMYSGIEEFASDVRLTFSNAMTYNPPGNDVHLMAMELKKSFERRWKDLDKKWNSEDDHGKSMAETTMETVRKNSNGVPSLQKDVLPKKSLLPEQQGIHRSSSLAARDDKVSFVFFRANTMNMQEYIETNAKNLILCQLCSLWLHCGGCINRLLCKWLLVKILV